MNRRRCGQPWYGLCPPPALRHGGILTVREHYCARPPGHPEPCMCWCGDRPAPDGQEPLWGGAA